MENKTEITTVDLWTETIPNHEDCIFGAFTDGWEHGTPFDSVKVVKNCNCVIWATGIAMQPQNKNHAVVFYKDGKVVRLLVCERETDVEKYVLKAMRYKIVPEDGRDSFLIGNVVSMSYVNKSEDPYAKGNASQNPDIGSCDRLPLLYCMMSGSWTEDASTFGQIEVCNLNYLPNATLHYRLETDEEVFVIDHEVGLLVGEDGNRIIAVQNGSGITRNKIESILVWQEKSNNL